MDVKNKTATQLIKSKLASLKEKLPPALVLYPLYFISSFLLSRGIVFGAASPFGLAASAFFGARRGSLYGLIGAAIGYLSVMDRINALKYIACIILIFTAHFVFADTSFPKSRLFAPLSVIIPSACINLVFLADAAFPLFDTALSVLETGLAAIGAVLFSSLRPGTKRITSLHLTSAFVLCAAFIIPLCDILVWQNVSLGRTVAFALVFLCAYAGGPGTGALCGAVFGFSVAAAGSSPELCMLYAILGTSAGVFSEKNKLLCCAISVPFVLFISVCLNPISFIPRVVELFAAALIFFLSANVFTRHTRRFFIRRKSAHDSHLRTYASMRLSAAAAAFGAIGKLIGENRSRGIKPPENRDSLLFERATREICKKCTLLDICWKRDFETTRDAINNADSAIRQNGFLAAGDFPFHFASRCLHIEDFVNSVNREIFAARYRNQLDAKIQESSELLTRQYAEASCIFSAISSDIADNTRFDEEAELSVQAALAASGILCDTAVYRDAANRINIHLCGKDLSEIATDFEQFRETFEGEVRVRLTAPQYTRGDLLDDIILRERPPLRALFGAAVKSKPGSAASGDSGSFFRPANGICALLLSDGMGSGKLAARESAASVSLLEGLLTGGISPQSALLTLQSALTFKAECTGTFSTLDLMYANLFTGICEFYKLGGAPTYIKRGRKLRRITASTLPAGINVGGIAAPDKTVLPLLEGDFVIMTSDGIADPDDDAKLLDFLSKSDDTSPKALADSILAFALAVCGKNDDMTVAVIKIEREE